MRGWLGTLKEPLIVDLMAKEKNSGLYARRNQLLCVGITLLLVLAYWSISSTAPGIEKRDTPLRVYEKDYAVSDGREILERVETTHRLLEEYAWPESKAALHQAQAECEELTQHEQLRDPKCSAVWLHDLRNGEISGVHEMWGFEDTHWGAITLELASGEKALFKPCTTSSEDTTKEIIAFHLDQVIGYGQTAPSITRRVPIEVIEQFCDTPKELSAFAETKLKCATEDGFFVGPMIGWWRGLTPVRTVNKYKLPLNEMPALRERLSENLYTAQMQSRFHSFYWLINILRHGKDEFVTPEGDLVSLDLDRSRYASNNKLPMDLSVNFTWCYTCYYDKWTVDTFRLIGPTAPPEFKIANLLNISLASEELYSNRIGQALTVRVKTYLDCVDHCIDMYGRNTVLLEEEKYPQGRELVMWYVTHSEYKDMNGKRGPDWFDWRKKKNIFGI